MGTPSHPPLIRRLSPVERVVITPVPVPNQPLIPTQPLDTALPVQFASGKGWQLTHRCPSTGEQVEWNWQYQEWFKEGQALSTYKLRDQPLLDELASVFTWLEPRYEDTPMGQYYEYHLLTRPGAEPLPTKQAAFPGVHYYTNAAGTAQFLALYQMSYQYDVEQPERAFFQVAIYEIVQVAVANEEELGHRIGRAQQAAIRHNRLIAG
ncbi:hypothetical protein [Hymenobacter cellulosilyticus]|uniref:Uncharacterized protein n=1 Tax=Hymenobacter cellulosilyticus TaxID=2932248 RepID=A0A8T9QAD3_9BACT|nr:hypothetical protein [Hymenobacter cellulosilyticus]UOQ71853.1 hypothetical protein MUN79_25160 [Hymenobacter cellulosilyticus]